MGIFSRMTDIINSNINAMLDQAEEPEKMVRLIIQEMEDTLVEVRSSSARVLAERKGAARRLEQVQSEAASWEEKARLAISKGREDLARAALQEKRAIEEEVGLVEAELETTDEHIAQLNEEVSQLQQKLDDARARQKALTMRSKTVESRIKVKRQIQREALDDAFHRFDEPILTLHERRQARKNRLTIQENRTSSTLPFPAPFFCADEVELVPKDVQESIQRMALCGDTLPVQRELDLHRAFSSSGTP